MTDQTSTIVKQAVTGVVVLYAIHVISRAAYTIRLGAIDEFGPVIHEFDPYFNFRATEYLYWNGWKRFFTWFDYKVWYPLGRPVGTTIYPGMQFTAVWLQRYLLPSMSLNDVCCYIPVWFGVIASAITGLIAYECTLPINTSTTIIGVLRDIWYGQKTRPTPIPATNTDTLSSFFPTPATEAGLFAMAFMSIVPAHLMRSMGGGYDNESVAITAMVLTFYLWIRSLRATTEHTTNTTVAIATTAMLGVLTGLSYFYMVATWGGYVFVLNLIGVHAAVLVAAGRFDTQVYLAYTLFYVTGTALAVQVPVVGWAPLKSLEQLGPCAVFGAYQLLYACEIIVARQKPALSRTDALKLRFRVLSIAAAAGIILAMVLAPTGYFGPISARVRGLFVQHTKTGNPLVDSVAEHQPASSRAYFQYLHHVCALAPFGYLVVMCQLSDASSFLLVWGAAAYFFSHKMVRLILLTAPIGSSLAGIAAGRLFAWCVRQWWSDQEQEDQDQQQANRGGRSSTQKSGSATDLDKMKKRKVPKKPSATTSSSNGSGSSFDGLASLQEAARAALRTKEGIIFSRTLAFICLLLGYFVSGGFINYCWRLAADLSNPTIIIKARLRDGQVIHVDDYREAYWWLRDNTPEDSRIMAWWDYGYQISAIANRTTLADGNTWNHEHIALLGMALTTDLDQGWEIARHLADYVLIWGGGGGDDLAKSPHLARIANSVYREHCPEDPTCRSFGFLDRQGTPSSMMRRSLLYRLHGHKIREGVTAPEDKFQEVYRSKYGKVRIYRILGISDESKTWASDPANRKCDAPGSWFCPGQYPPALSAILSRKKDFQQLEDFNRGKADEEYVKAYFQDLRDPTSARRKVLEKERQEMRTRQQEGLTEAEKEEQSIKVEQVYNAWADTEDTTLMWKLISTNAVDELKAWLEAEPHKAFVRSKDGRGPMWWAFEQRNEEITKLLMKAGVPHTDKDAKGLAPVDLLEGGKE